MFKTLKRALTHHIQTMDHNFMCLDLSLSPTDDLYIRRLETLGMSIDRLRFTLEGLPISHELIERVVLHNIRTQVTTISTNIQLLHLKYKVSPTELIYLETILTECQGFTEALENTKALATAMI